MSSKVGVAYKQFVTRVTNETITSVVRKGWEKNLSVDLIAELSSIPVKEVLKLISQFEKEKIKP